MLKLLFALLAISTINPVVAMEPNQKQPHKTIILEPAEWEGETLQKNWPLELTVFSLQEPVTDELLLELNPAWRKIRDHCSAQTKEQIFREIQSSVLSFVLTPFGIVRTLQMLMLCVGRDSNLDDLYWFFGSVARHEDVECAKYLLAKGARPKLDAIKYCKTVGMAELLFENGAEMPEKDILRRICSDNSSVELMQFYLDKGLVPTPECSHALMYRPCDDPCRDKKVSLLFDTGFDFSFQDDKGDTILHRAAKAEGVKFCKRVVSHYQDQHQAFLGFLWYIKNNFPDFYRHKDMRVLCLKDLSPMRKLHHFLSLKEKEYGRTAYWLFQHNHFESGSIEEFNPETCTYEKFMNLRKAAH